MLYGLCCGGLLFLLAMPLTDALYQKEEAGRWLMLFALLAPMLYCDSLVAVSYTHLDVYKRQVQQLVCLAVQLVCGSGRCAGQSADAA